MTKQRHVIDIDDAVEQVAPPPLPAPVAPPMQYAPPPQYAAAPPQYAAAPPMAMQQTIIVTSQKSVVGAVFLALFFGPLGMLYATVPGAIAMFFVNLLIAIPTLGLGLLVTVPAGAIWAGVAASGHNRQITAVSQTWA